MKSGDFCTTLFKLFYANFNSLFNFALVKTAGHNFFYWF